MQRNEEQNGRVQYKGLDRTLPVETTTEILLPDYRSEVSRLLWVHPTFMPASRFVGNGKIEFSGPICYRALYMDPAGELYGVESEGSYAFSVPREGLEPGEAVQTTVELVPDAVISRVLGPRKLSVKCRMHVRVQGYADKNLTPRVSGESGDAEQMLRLCDAGENGRMMASEVESFHAEDVMSVEAGEGELRVISARGELFVSEAIAGEDCARCRGEVLLSLLCCREGNGEAPATPFALQRRVPFEHEVPMEGVMPDWHVSASGGVGAVSAEVDGDTLTLGADAFITAQGQCRESVLLHRDAFLPGQHADCRVKEESLWDCGFCGNRNFSISGERSFSEIGIPKDAAILDVMADAEIKEKKSEEGRSILRGDMHCHVLYRHLGEYEVGEFLIPFRGIFDETWDDMAVCCRATSCRVTTNAEGVRADAEISFALRTYCEKPIAILSEVSFSPVEKVPKADMELCFPYPGDSLWSIGKRYGVSPDDLAAVNGLVADGYDRAENLQGVKYLLLP